jgi:hypothetical protein
MVFGHNTNVTIAGSVFHVQTEDRGIVNALIDTTVYCRGRVLHRRTNSYFDLLPLNADREQALRLRLDDQHRTVVDELRSGALQLAPPPVPPAPPAPAPRAPAPVAMPPATLTPVAAPPANAIALELINARNWLVGRHASLHVAVRLKDGGAALIGAKVTARIDGAADRAEFSTETEAYGQARLEFDMPRLAAEETALVIEASFGAAHGQLRFQLRAKPKVPAAG